VSAVWNQFGGASPSLKSFSYIAYSGDESDIAWSSSTVDVYSTVTFSGNEAVQLYQDSNRLSSFADGNNPLINIQDAINEMSTSNLTASFSETTKVKSGWDFDLPLSLEFGGGLGVNFGVIGESAYSYQDGAGVRYRGSTYWTSQSIVTNQMVAEQTTSIEQYIVNIIYEKYEMVKNAISTVVDDIKNGVSNGLSTVSSTVAGWYAAVSSAVEGGTKSSAILTLRSATEPDTNTAISATVGEPYLVTVYTDESCLEAVSEEAMAAQPVTLTLGYTDELLAEAGAAPGAQVYLLRFDRERDLYLPVDGAVQDDSAMTVSAQITKNGEYILAVDTLAPIVTDFAASDATPAPELFALVSDLSGLGAFRFWLDDGADLVTMENLDEYYDPITGVFTFAVQTPLEEGNHTAYFQTTDTLGNGNPVPVSFEFEVHTMQGSLGTPETSVAVITEDEPFTVTVTASENSAFTGVVLLCEFDGYGSQTILMERSGNVWTAEVLPVPGAERMRFTAVAGDDYGNTLRSEAVEVELALPALLNELTISEILLSSVDDVTVAEVTILSPEGVAASGILVAAAYDADGRMLAMGSLPVGLRSGDELTVSIPIAVSTNVAACVKAFFLDPNGYIPLCAAFAR
jgi:hypothetical protein